MNNLSEIIFRNDFVESFPGDDSGSTVPRQTLKKLKNTYQCDSIEIELTNWEEDDAAESTLTVCLINSKAIPPSGADDSYQELVKIASQIKEALKKPKKYNSYYIIFVSRQKHSPGTTFDAHTLGANIPASEL